MSPISSKIVPIPVMMRTLEKDRRGFPIPYIVMRDKDGRPHFTINDQAKVEECIRKRLCAISGKKLRNGAWFIGGPKSFFHPYGAFIDPPTNEECARYAIRVCPFLAAPHYNTQIDDRTLEERAKPDDMTIVKDMDMLPDRPTTFCLGVAADYSLVKGRGQHTYLRPGRWHIVEFWRHGLKITDEDEQARIVREGAA